MLLAFLTGCNLIGSGPASRVEVRPGVIVLDDGTSDVSLSAATIDVGETLTVTVSTFGSGSCIRPADADVDVRGLQATIAVMDSVFIPGPGEACTMDLAGHPRTVSVSFSEPGHATIRLVGRRLGGGDAVIEREVSVE